MPSLEVTLAELPRVYLKMTSTTGETTTETISEGGSTSSSKGVNYGHTTSSGMQHGWSFGFHWGFGKKTSPEKAVSSEWSIGFNLGTTGSYNSSQGASWTSTSQQTYTETYNRAEAKAVQESKTITGAKVQVSAKLKNTGNIAYNISALKLMLSAYTVHSGVKNIVEVTHAGGIGELKPGEEKLVMFENSETPRSYVEQFIRNPGALFLNSTMQEISLTFRDDAGRFGITNFTDVYTNTEARTAQITIDYGPQRGDVQTYRVATSFKKNPHSLGSDDKYLPISLKEIFDIIGLKYTEGDVEFTHENKETNESETVTTHGLVSIDNLAYDKNSNSAWFITVNRASSPKLVQAYSVSGYSYDLSKIMIQRGDKVHIYYNTDNDHDGVSSYDELLLGTSDENVDSDGDGINDYDEIYGWTRDIDGKTIGPFITNPASKDTDYDGLDDNVDNDPINPFKAGIIGLESISVNGAPLFKKYAMTIVHNGSATVVVKTANPVGRIGYKRRNDETYNYVSLDNVNFYHTFQLNDVVVGTDTVYVETVSQDEKTTQIDTVIVLSELESISAPELTKPESRNRIMVNFERVKDDRVLGYVVLRALASKTSDSEALKKMTTIEPRQYNFVKGEKFDDFVVAGIIEKDNDKAFEDDVGAGSPYYSYRVYSYAKKGDKFVYSESKGLSTTSVGRIKFKFQLVEVGTEYYFHHGHPAGRYDMRVKARFAFGLKDVHEYNYWFQDAGSAWSGNTIIWETMADNSRTDSDSDDQPIDRSVHEIDVGSEGLTIYFDNDADIDDYGVSANQNVKWSYSQLSDALSQKDGVVPGTLGGPPFNDGKMMTFTWGKQGISLDAACSNCGEEPHAGYRLKFWYEFLDK